MAGSSENTRDLEARAGKGAAVAEGEASGKPEHVHGETVKRALAAMPDDDLLVDISELFKVFGDSTRTKILAALSVDEMCVACISEILNMSVSAVSHQLRILRQSKLVKTRRSGKEIYYSLDDDHIGRILTTALEHVKEL
ncbi:MAG: metalloregulator ArsR/SmtB family transcription factor [Roseburia sp.]|nr:metalloregulator ArsR/SmtB family transcription factor [Roseburia sp.]